MPMKRTSFARHLLARNPCVLIQSMHSLGVEPSFGAESRAAPIRHLQGQYSRLVLQAEAFNFESLTFVAAVWQR